MGRLAKPLRVRLRRPCSRWSSGEQPPPSPCLARCSVRRSQRPMSSWTGTRLQCPRCSLRAPPPSPFAQARFMAITQLAVFEAVNAVTGRYQPYLGTIDAPEGASAEAAAIAAAHTVLRNYFPASTGALDAARAISLLAIPDGQAKDDGIATGEAAAAAMILLRTNDGSSPPEFFVPGLTGARGVGGDAELPDGQRRSGRCLPPMAQRDAVRNPQGGGLSRRIRRRRSPAGSTRRTTSRS